MTKFQYAVIVAHAFMWFFLGVRRAVIRQWRAGIHERT